MSDSVRPHRQQPTRLPHPWDSLGNNTGVGCHFLLQCMKVKSEHEVVQSCPTLHNPMDCSLPGSSVQGIFQARVLEWAAIAFSYNTLFSPKFWKERELYNLCIYYGGREKTRLYAFFWQKYSRKSEVVLGIIFNKFLVWDLTKPYSGGLNCIIPWEKRK